jgi:PTH1 family peptidyl-tRNA hydrolase
VTPELRAIAGLGNPGSRYERTRHNAGFLVLEALARDAGANWRHCGDREECRVRLAGAERLLVRPLSFMNRSGAPLATALDEAGVRPDETLVVVDDVALPAGRLRLRFRGGPGGHNGLASVCESLGTEEFARLRLGVGPAPEGVDLAEFVLEPMADLEWSGLLEAARRAAAAVRDACELGIQAAMNRHNPAATGEDGDAGGSSEKS